MQTLMPTGAIARTQLDTARADWLVASARLKSSEAALRNARESLGWTRLLSPKEGIITAVSASAGQIVSAGQSVLTLATGEARDVVFDVAAPDEIPHQIRLISASPCSATRRSMLQRCYAISRLRPIPDPYRRVRATLNNPPAAMALGASVTVTLPSSAACGYVLPASALSRYADKPAVFVINRQSQAQLRVVVPARYTASSVIIASGLAPGDRVITAGVSKLRSGEQVIAGEEQP